MFGIVVWAMTAAVATIAIELILNAFLTEDSDILIVVIKLLL